MRRRRGGLAAAEAERPQVMAGQAQLLQGTSSLRGLWVQRFVLVLGTERTRIQTATCVGHAAAQTVSRPNQALGADDNLQGEPHFAAGRTCANAAPVIQCSWRARGCLPEKRRAEGSGVRFGNASQILSKKVHGCQMSQQTRPFLSAWAGYRLGGRCGTRRAKASLCK